MLKMRFLFQKLKFPSWVITNPAIVASMDFLTVAPIGLAAHIVCKEARGKNARLIICAGFVLENSIVWALITKPHLATAVALQRNWDCRIDFYCLLCGTFCLV